MPVSADDPNLDPGGLDDVIGNLRTALEIEPDNTDLRHELGAALLQRYDAYGEGAAVIEAVRLLRECAAAEDNISYLGSLGAALRLRYEVSGDAASLDESVSVLVAAMERGAPGSAMKARIRVNLAVAMEARAKYTASPADAAEAVRLLREGLADADDDGRPDQMSNLANAIATEYEISGGIDRIAEAVDLLRQATASAPADHPHLPSFLSNLGDALRNLYRATGDVVYLRESVEAARASLDVAKPGNPGLPEYLANHAGGLLDLYECSGDSTLIEEAIGRAREAVAATPPSSSQQGFVLSCLGNSLREWYEATGELDALDEAISCDRKAVELAGPRDAAVAAYLSNLAISLTLRFEHTPDPALLEAALEAARSGVARSGPSDPETYHSLLTLARTEYIAFLATPRRDSLTRSIEAERMAIERIGDQHAGLAACLGNLAASLIVYQENYGGADTSAVDEAIGLLRRVAALTQPDQPDSVLDLYNLGSAFETRYAATGDRADAEQAAAAYRSAAFFATAPPSVRAEAAMEWGRQAAKIADWSAAAAGFGHAIGLLPLVSPRHFKRSDQEHLLTLFSGLASDAAACALACDETDAIRAVTLLEQGRGVLLGHLLDASADIANVQAADPELAHEFEMVRDEFDSLDSGPHAPPSASPRDTTADPRTRHELTARRGRLARRMDELIEQIRNLPGLRDFLAAPSEDAILAAGVSGPVVYVNISQYRCDALVIAGGGVRVVPLTAVTAADVTALSKRYLALFERLRRLDQLTAGQLRRASAGVREVCAWLWDRIARPVLDEIGLPPRDRDWPRLWWCPTGALALLPLHAAQRYDPSTGADTGVADRVTSSHTATVRILTASRARAPAATSAGLVVAMAETPDLPPLPNVDQEIEAILAAASPPPLVLRDSAASLDAVRAALPSHPWFHFAGHSVQELADPGQGRLCLRDGNLTAMSITGLRLSSAELAYLSSCEGAIAGASVPDEPIHLTVALQVAGYRNVVAAAWSVGDTDAATMAAGVYRCLARSGGTADGAVARALHEVVMGMRATRPPAVWAAYQHAGV